MKKFFYLFAAMMLTLMGVTVTSCGDDNDAPSGGDNNQDVKHKYVDLGLPSGTLWATMNVGATKPEEYGDYFAWGETTPKDNYHGGTYKWLYGSSGDVTLTKYCTKSHYGYNGFVDNKRELDPEDDAAFVNWGPKWRMPSKEQMQELIDNCTSEWTTRNGVNGRLFTSKHNGASLFLPATGFCFGSYLNSVGSVGIYWMRTLDSGSPCYAYRLISDFGVVSMQNYYRYNGHSVRAVRLIKK